jgi:MoxR-like ATPase
MSSTLAKPKRVLLRGFDDNQRPDVATWIRSQGIEVIQLPSLAELIVAGPDSPAELLQRAQTKNSKVVGWDEFKAFLMVHKGPARIQPEGGGAPTVSQNAEGVSSKGDLPEADLGALLPIERTPSGLRILDVILPHARRDREEAGWIPGAEQFAHLCMDKPFLETLRAVALGALHQMPVALEGETAASKTSSVLFLAHLLEQPVVRINLSGHTDAAELVGRYVPADSARLLDWDKLHPDTPWLRDESRSILALAAAEQRSLSANERLAILGREQFPLNSWRFQEGYLPRAMRHGWWLLLDEINLAETQVLERLNCALENPPGLVLTEGDGTIFGRGGSVPVHPSFRMMATLNPAEYAGRAILSQAFVDRWGIWHQAAVPGEREIEHMLRFLVFGEHPRVVIDGLAYRAPESAPVYPELQGIPQIHSLLQRLAVFHHGIFRAAGGCGGTPSIGRLNRERYSFSRRVLLNLMEYVARKIRSGSVPSEVLIPEAVQTLYLARVRGEADRKAVNNILRAGGLL